MQNLNAAILELTGGEVDAQLHALHAFERETAGLIAVNPDGMKLTPHFLLAPGVGPGAICNGLLQGADTAEASFLPGDAAPVAIYARRFAARQCALVERALHGRLLAVWEGIPMEERALVRWHFIVTLARETGPHGAAPIHADTFDGTMAAFALMSTKSPTPIYPRATFAPPALARFVEESQGAPGHFRPDEIHVLPGAAGPRRGANPAALVVLPGAVAHSVPATAPRGPGTATVDSRGAPVAADGDARWFCRVSVELVPAAAGGEDPWLLAHAPWPAGSTLRRRIAVLVAEHVWGDGDFAHRAAGELLGAGMMGGGGGGGGGI
jgi:hypothetical protein